MPTGPKSEKRPADVIDNAVRSGVQGRDPSGSVQPSLVDPALQIVGNKQVWCAGEEGTCTSVRRSSPATSASRSLQRR